MESKFTLHFFIFVNFCIFQISLVAQNNHEVTCDNLSINAELTAACTNGSQAEIRLTVVQGTPPYQVKWEDGANTLVRKLPAGSYKVQVTDALGCEEVHEISVPQKQPISVVPSIKHTSKVGKRNGEITLNVNGGSPPYRYTWISSSQGVLQAMAEGVDHQKKLSQGIYQILVFDAAGCYGELETEVR